MTTVDARGLRCPMPLVMTKVALERLEPGDELLVLATDPEAPIDIGAWAADNGHQLVEARGANDWTELLLTKSALPPDSPS